MPNNPFAVVSPEEMSAEQANQLFVEMFSEYPQIGRPGNIMINGARGCGKSMLIRCSLPDVQMIKDAKRLSDLDNLAFSVSCKKTYPNIKEFDGLENKHVPYLINEHFLSLHVVMYALLQLSELKFDEYNEDEYRLFFEKTYKRYLRLSRCKEEPIADYASANAFFKALYLHMEELQLALLDYPLRFMLNTEGEDYIYNLPLFSFMKFILPVFKGLTQLTGFPRDKNIVIFIDDADNLSKIQTEVLNTWISYRTQPTVSIKTSSQLGLYKTYLTSTGVLIETPHDYQAVNISNKYTTDIDTYVNKAKDILKKRLQIEGIHVSLEDFFPDYDIQVAGIQAEIEKIKADYPSTGRGFRESDDVRRYAIPNYIKNLGGTRKSRATYRYAGLDNIIHLSSGIIRYLLDSTADMYDKQVALLESEEDKSSSREHFVLEIDSKIQNAALRDQADRFLYSELIKFSMPDVGDKDAAEGDFDSLIPIDNPVSDIQKLQNLISAMGRTFHDILVSERSERKVFSIALTNNPDKDLRCVLRLGVRLGFLHESRIGTKDGSGRTWLYILNRCFAPLFTLDPTSFQGYLFVTNDALHQALLTGRQLRSILTEDLQDDDIRQLTMEDVLEDYYDR